jgi:hypothetical protein
MTSSPTARDRLLADPVIQALIAALRARAPWARSLIVFGSRAGHSDFPLSGSEDYDAVVAVPSLCAPFAVRALGSVRREVERQHEAKVSLNPVPAFRLARPGGNYMVFKLGREGITVHGRELLAEARRVEPGKVSPFWRFFYLASQSRRLLNASPTLAGEGGPRPGARAVSYAAAKAIAACAEITVLFEADKYATSLDELAPLLAERGLAGLADDLVRARGVVGGPEDWSSATGLWWRARDRLLACFDEAALAWRGVPYGSAEFERRYLNSAGPVRFVRDLQFSALSLASFRELPVRTVVDRRGIAERMKLASVLLLASLRRDGAPDREHLAKVRRLLRGAVPLPPEAEAGPEWRSLNMATGRYFPVACVALGL